ncbi:hypothetical protein ACFU99_42860, partial [Streptomyces sp. NPDC057654]
MTTRPHTGAHTPRPAPQEARDRAAAFLVRGRQPDGWWRDFDVNGPSSSWLTAYVAAALAGCGAPGARRAAEDAWALLAADRARRGWGYGPTAPPDADTTTWVLRLAEAVGAADEPAAEDGYAFLTAHIRPDGGVATYAHESAGEFFDRHPVPGGWDGWYAGHTCVTAAAAGLRGLARRAEVRGCLRERQRPDGSWQSYWWTEHEYATALAAGALGAEAAESAAARAWAAARCGPDGAVRTAAAPDGSAFATALAALTLDGGAEPLVDGGEPAPPVRWLLRAQSPSGGWP